MKFKLLAIIISAIAVLGLATTGIVISNDPANVAAKTLANFTEDLSDRIEYQFFEEVFTNGSVSASISEKKGEYSELLPFHNINGKIYFSKNAFMVENFEFRAPYNRITFDFYSSNEEIYVKNEDYLLGAYGIRFNTFERDLSNSIFSPNSDSDYALDQERYNYLLELIRISKDKKELKKDFEKLSKRVLKDIWKIAKKEFTFTSDAKMITLNEKEIKTKVTSIIIDANSLVSFVEKVYMYLENDKHIIDFINKYETLFKYILDEDFSIEEYQEFLNEIKDSLDDILENLNSDFEIVKINMFNKNGTNKLLKFEVNVGDKNVLNVEFDNQSIAETKKIFVSYGNCEIYYKINKNDNDEFDSAIEITADKGKIIEYTHIINLNVNKKENKYSAYYQKTGVMRNVTDVTKKYTINGNLVHDEDSFKFSFNSVDHYYHERSVATDSIKYSYNGKYDVSGEFVLAKKDIMPKPISDYKTFDQFTEEDCERLSDFL